MILKGISVSEGVAIGKTYHHHSEHLTATKEIVKDYKKELTKLKSAISKAKKDILELKKLASKSLTEEEEFIFDAHISILEDIEFLKEVKELIEKEKYSCAFAYQEVSNKYLDLFSNIENSYMYARKADISDVFNRVMQILLGYKPKELVFNEPVILVSDNLTPEQTIGLNFKHVKAIVSKTGSYTSHASIIARSLGIPAIIGYGINDIANNNDCIVDGTNNTIIVNPTIKQINKYNEIITLIEKEKKELNYFKDRKTKTKDGHKIKLALNVASELELKGSKISEGIGLYRTEFLFMEQASMPTEELQEKVYLKALSTNKNEQITIRTLDIGGDKNIPYLKLNNEANPFLGLRAIRLSLTYKDMFKTQLRALLKANKYSNLQIMVPMIAVEEEILKTKELLKEVELELKTEKIKINPYKFGIMVEIPVCALNIKYLLKHVDFISIGSNDLIQYLFAADRMNDQVGYLYQPYHPTFLKLLNNIIKEAKKQSKEVSLCGEVGSSKYLSLVLVGMGIDKLSMNEPNILKIRSLLSKVNYKDLEKLAKKVLTFNNNQEVKNYLVSYLEKIENN